MSESTIIALVAALFGGGGLKFLEHILSRNKDRTDLATQLRNELRGEVTALRDEMRQIEAELDKWKARYYRLLAFMNDIRIRCIGAGIDVPAFDEELDKGE